MNGRRWMTFSMRTLLVVMLLVLLVAAWEANEQRASRREQAIAEQLMADGADVILAGIFDDPDLEPDEQPWWRSTLSYAAGIRITSVVAILDRRLDVSRVSQLTNLRELLLSYQAIDDVSSLMKLRKLER